jgi:hypothetical protein
MALIRRRPERNRRMQPRIRPIDEGEEGNEPLHDPRQRDDGTSRPKFELLEEQEDGVASRGGLRSSFG